MTTAREIVADVESRIAAGQLEPGDRLLSVRSAALELSVAPNTVAAAYRQLRDRGVVVGKGRQGTSVAHRTAIVVAPTAPVPPGTIDVMTGEPDPQMLPNLERALGLAARAPQVMYGGQLVLDPLAQAARRWLRADAILASNLTITSGAMDAIERVLVEHLRFGDRIGIEDPGHSPVLELVATMGLKAVPIALDDEGISPGGLGAALDAGIQALIVTPRAQNPTGAAFSHRRVAQLDRLLDQHPSVLVIEDDHAGPVSGVALAGLSRERPAWAVVRSVSKSLGPDLRLALLAGDPETIDRVQARLARGPGWISHLLQRTVATLLDDPATATLIDQAADRYRANREHLISKLAAGGVVAVGASGLQVWIPVSEEQPVLEALRDAGYALRGGAPYRSDSAPAVRVTVAALDEEQLDEIADLLITVLRRQPVRSTRLA